MPTELTTEAIITPTTDERGRRLSDQQAESGQIRAHFNPESLKFSITNQVQKGRGSQPPQVLSQSSAKLTMELIFDTTMTGEDVRQITWKIAEMMDPVLKTTRTRRGGRKEHKVPAIVVFEWGTNRFEGYINSFKETLDFFSEDGIPLRSSVSLSMSQQEPAFAPLDAGSSSDADTAQVVQPQAGQSLDQVAGTSGNSAATRDFANQNGLDNMRSLPSELVANPSSNLGRPPALFESSASFSAGFSAGVSGGFSAGISGGLSAGVSGGFSANITGPTVEAFAGLQGGLSLSTPRLRSSFSAGIDIQPPSVEMTTGGSASFGLGGQVTGGSSSLSADVGLKTKSSVSIKFQE